MHTPENAVLPSKQILTPWVGGQQNPPPRLSEKVSFGQYIEAKLRVIHPCFSKVHQSVTFHISPQGLRDFPQEEGC